MWLFTKAGFFSVVENQKDKTTVKVRGRFAEDFEKLREYLPFEGEVTAYPHSDYPFRVIVTKEQWADAMFKLGSDLHYSNFKGMVAKWQGPERAHAYMKIWDVMQDIQTVPSLYKPFSTKHRDHSRRGFVRHRSRRK